MLQRIQSLFLLFAAGLQSIQFLPQFGLLAAPPNPQHAYLADGLINGRDLSALWVLFGLGAAMSLVAIFMFKNRKQQVLVARLSIITILFALLLTVYQVHFVQKLPVEGMTPSFGLYAAVASAVLAMLAARAIRKDEKLVRSIDRLR
jgi:peptidoglycan/LPS O-acetylase OafA/YrhL